MKHRCHLVPSALLVVWFTSSVRAQDCSYEKYNFDTCMALGGSSASTSCESCVNLFSPGLQGSCASINNGVCTGLANCPCGSCDTSALQVRACIWVWFVWRQSLEECISHIALCHISIPVLFVPNWLSMLLGHVPPWSCTINS